MEARKCGGLFFVFLGDFGDNLWELCYIQKQIPLHFGTWSQPALQLFVKYENTFKEQASKF